ncbi:MAG: hypothetical protein K6U14_07930 [Firmicutes bacterium]|nr:hypothetical protein [Alicyclobacillaceae bacterium]MCL6497545.1 hypothetical protein [Bacillota bacterium]
MAVEFIDPTGGEPKVPKVTPAPRFAQLTGLRFNILDNGKMNAGTVLSEVAERLEAQYGARLGKVVRKRSPSQPALPEELAAAVEGADFVITGVGD